MYNHVNLVSCNAVEGTGQFQRYGCDIFTQNDKQNPSEKLHFLHDKKMLMHTFHSKHLDEGKAKKNI